jgi:MOSC domain-containing protein YiiM
LGIKNLTSLLVKEHKTGFYLRVLQTGKITPNDRLELISREYPKFTIEYINKIAFNTKENQENIQELLKCDKLSKRYRSSLEQRYQAKEVGLQVWQRDV